MDEIEITATVKFRFIPVISRFQGCEDIQDVIAFMKEDIENTLQTEMPDNSIIKVTGEIKQCQIN